MAASFDDLSEQQKENYFSRAEKLGFLRDAALRATGQPERRTLRIDTIQQLKDLIGVPDEHIEKGSVSDTHIKYAAREWPAERSALTHLALTDEERDEVGDAAHAYLYGHSAKVKSYESIINSSLLPRDIEVTTEPNRTVTKDDPLIIDRESIKNFGVITIEPGGQIIVKANSDVTVQKMVKE